MEALLLLLLLIGAISLGVAVLARKYLIAKVKSGILRAIFTGLAFTIAIVLCLYSSAILLFSWMYPTANKEISGEYSFSQRPYGFATTPTNGYFLTFYRTHSLWFDEKVGRINLECMGSEEINAEIKYGHNNYNRLIIKVDNQVKVDTMLHFEKQFDFKREAYSF